MTIAIVNVTVPLSGEGPAADISALVGEKTVILTGTFTGRYVLLGSHDNSTFVPVVVFDANGRESVKMTLPNALRSVKVRSGATSAVGVAMSVSGISSPGENLFSPTLVLPVGTSGPQAIVDLFAAFPPTGLEADLNIICRGGFTGQIVVEGSNDGIGFNPIGSFRADPQGVSLLGGSLILEFSPLLYKDQVRYVRLVVNATITSAVSITMGGDCSITVPGGGSMLAFSDDDGRAAVGLTEVILYEFTVNLNNLLLGSSITAQLNAIRQLVGRGNATFNLYLGATTPGDTTGGTLRATTSTSSATEVNVSVVSAPFVNAGGLCLVQVTGLCDDGESVANIRGMSINIG